VRPALAFRHQGETHWVEVQVEEPRGTIYDGVPEHHAQPEQVSLLSYSEQWCYGGFFRPFFSFRAWQLQEPAVRRLMRGCFRFVCSYFRRSNEVLDFWFVGFQDVVHRKAQRGRLIRVQMTLRVISRIYF